MAMRLCIFFFFLFLHTLIFINSKWRTFFSFSPKSKLHKKVWSNTRRRLKLRSWLQVYFFSLHTTLNFDKDEWKVLLKSEMCRNLKKRKTGRNDIHRFDFLSIKLAHWSIFTAKIRSEIANWWFKFEKSLISVKKLVIQTNFSLNYFFVEYRSWF